MSYNIDQYKLLQMKKSELRQLIKEEISKVIKESEYKKLSEGTNVYTYTLLNKGDKTIKLKALNRDEANNKIIKLHPGSDPMLTHENGEEIIWDKKYHNGRKRK